MPDTAMPDTAMFNTVLVANRGEIAVRIFRTLRRLGVRSVAVYSDADTAARHVREADVAVRLGPAPAADSYLSIDRILAAARRTGADAIHPGYGFLAESAAFARACAEAGLAFIGPPAGAIEVMGDKIQAKLAVSAAGVPVVPGRSTPGMTDDDLVAAASDLGYPLLLKPSAGGGGKGMHVVESSDRLRQEIAGARREAAAFGDDTLFLERLVPRPRHIEVQVLADAHGNAVHLGERECSLQRRHQKVIEEAPSAILGEATRARIGAAAVQTARSVGYVGAGTVEFIVSADAPDDFFFIEMNTRLQVEHPVTELVTGLDLVEQQLRVAVGDPLEFTQSDVRLNGHAVEARLYAEDPARGFLPTGGTTLVVREPAGPDLRVDSSLVPGGTVGTSYDPMLAKLIAWAPHRAEALRRLDRALADTVVLGVTTNAAFLRALLRHRDVLRAELDTGLIERDLAQLVTTELPHAAYLAWAAHRLQSWIRRDAQNPWTARNGWRLLGDAETVWRVELFGGEQLEIGVRGDPRRPRIRVGEHEPVATEVSGIDDVLLLSTADQTYRIRAVTDAPVSWLWVDGTTYEIRELHAARRGRSAGPHDGEVRSPMPGTVVAVPASAGDEVAKGSALVVVEAMKMEHTLRAPFDGHVGEVLVRAGDQVALEQPLARLVAAAQESS